MMEMERVERREVERRMERWMERMERVSWRLTFPKKAKNTQSHGISCLYPALTNSSVLYFNGTLYHASKQGGHGIRLSGVLLYFHDGVVCT
jgi:hypothetical protein